MLGIIVLTILCFVGAIMGFLYFEKPIPTVLVPMPVIEKIVEVIIQEKVRPALPARLTIPAIGVDAAIESVGITPDGAMDIPQNIENVAWFSLGSRPGEKGSAVLAGHYGYKDDRLAVFDNLYKLRKGDKIYTQDEKGIIVTYVVRETRRYDPKADAFAVFGPGDDKMHLNLITCEGDWSTSGKSYSTRLVVFTDKEEVKP